MIEDIDLTGMSHEDAKAYVAGFVQNLKLVQQKRRTVQEELETWQKRVDLAASHGREDLKAQAETRVQWAREELARLAAEEKSLALDVTDLKHLLKNKAHTMEMSVDAQALAEQLEEAAGDAVDPLADEMKDAETDMSLEELKREMGLSGESE